MATSLKNPKGRNTGKTPVVKMLTSTPAPMYTLPRTDGAGRDQIILMNGLPRVVFSQGAWYTMQQYIHAVHTEIGWLGTVQRDGNDFRVTEVFMVEQFVHGCETLITESGQNRLQAELLAATAPNPVAARQFVDNARNSDELGDVFAQLVESYGCNLMALVDRGNTLRFWGHSHVNMRVNPSGPDDQQMEKYRDQKYDYMLRGIFNKQGVVRIDLYDYKGGLIVTDIEWSCERAPFVLDGIIAAEIAKKVSAGKTRTRSQQIHPWDRGGPIEPAVDYDDYLTGIQTGWPEGQQEHLEGIDQ